jgi:hypothetical protein
MEANERTPVPDWTTRNPLFQSFSTRELERLAREGTPKDRRAAKAELAYRASA